MGTVFIETVEESSCEVAKVSLLLSLVVEMELDAGILKSVESELSDDILETREVVINGSVVVDNCDVVVMKLLV